MTITEIASSIRYDLGLLQREVVIAGMELEPADVDELIRISALLGDMCEKYGIDRYGRVKE